jgi:methionyl-tRNA formyltransferase
MRVIYFGTPAFAVPSLTALIEAHEVVGVVTQPDRQRGRGHKVSAGPVKTLAVAHGIPVFQPTRLRDTEWLDQLAALRADLGVVAAYGRIMPQALLDLPRLGCINVHASLLPRWRGAAPIHRAVIAGDATTGVTIMRVVLALDAGPMLSAATIPITTDDTSASLEPRLASLGAELLITTIAEMEAGTSREIPQDETRVTYAARLERHESQVDWARPAAVVDRQIRGLQPWPLAAAIVGGTRVAFLRSTAVPADSLATPTAQPGTVVSANAGGLVVACAEGAVCITDVLPEGRRVMPVAAFLNGTPIAAGSVIAPLPLTNPAPPASPAS